MEVENSGENENGTKVLAFKKEKPLVSIGLPVYNGENYLELAIQSILAQTLRDFELIICDNASTDSTEAICRRYELKDSRIIYHRNHKNLGAAANYDLCFEKSRGEFFRWAAHDDMLAPEYLEKTVKALLENPDAVKCATAIREIDENGKTRRIYQEKYLGGHQKKAHRRFGRMVSLWHTCNDFFVLYRREALVGSQLHGDYVESDWVLIAEMALRGQSVRLEEPLFLHREHNNRYTRKNRLNRANAMLWWNPALAENNRPRFVKWIKYINYFRAVGRSAPSKKEKFMCYMYLIYWPFLPRNFVHLTLDTLWIFNPKRFLSNRADQRIEKLV